MPPYPSATGKDPMLTDLPLRFLQTVRRYVADQDAASREHQRVYVLFAIALFKLLNFFGGNWDIQWHIAIGRDNLFIPPHLMVLVAFGGGITLAWFWIVHETFAVRADEQPGEIVRVGILQAPPAFFGIFLGYACALLSGLFDEWWHETFGIDSTLWSPPHICIMASTLFVDLNLMIGISTAARRLGMKFEPRSPLFWGLALTGAFTFEAVNFQMSQAFIEAYRVNGSGLMGVLFPILVGALFPMPLLLSIKIARQFRVALVIFAVAISLQLVGIGIAAAGFAILKPASVIVDFIRLNPESSISKASAFISDLGFSGWVGFLQTWSLLLSALPLGLVSLLDFLPWARRRPLVAAPVYSASLVAISFIWFKQMPVMRDYATAWPDVLLGGGLSVGMGIVLGMAGLRIARLVPGEGSKPGNIE